MQLADAAVDQHQPRHGLTLLLQARVAARDHLAHAGEIVVADNRADDEFAVIGLLHASVFPHHHAGHLVGALDMRDIETLDALGRLGQVQRILHGFLHGARGGLQHAKAGIETVLGVGLHQVEHGLLLAALRRVNLHLAAALFREQLFERRAILEIHGYVDDRGHVALIEIDLLQQSGKELWLVELLLVFPEMLATVHDLAIAQMEDVQRHQRRLGVDGEDIDIVALGRGHLLALFHFLHSGQQVA